MKRIILIFVLCLFSISSFAVTSRDVSSTGFDSLSEADKLAVMQEIEKKKAAMSTVTPPSVETVDKVSKWVEIGSNIGKGLAGAAKELGIAANEFANTPVGRLTIILIVWHFMGGVLVHIIGGLVVLVIGATLIYIFIRNSNAEVITYEGTSWWGGSKIKSRERSKLSGNDLGWIIIITFITLIVWALTTFTF